VGLGISVTPANPGDNATVTISGLAAYETITDALDHITFSGNANTLSAAEVNSGLTLNSTYTSSGQPVNTLTVTAGVTTAAGTANSAAKAITVTDPPVTTIAAAPQLSEPSASQHGTLVASIPNPGGIDHLVALMDQFTAAGFHEDKTGAGAITSMFGSIGSDENVAFLATPRFHHA